MLKVLVLDSTCITSIIRSGIPITGTSTSLGIPLGTVPILSHIFWCEKNLFENKVNHLNDINALNAFKY